MEIHMKKTIAFLLCVIMLLMCSMPILSAVETEDGAEEYNQLREHSITYSCVYDSENVFGH